MKIGRKAFGAKSMGGLSVVVIGAFIVVAAHSSPNNAAGVRTGIFGNVRESNETGDLIGLEIQFLDGKPQQIVTTLCEGWCHTVYQTSYVNRGNLIYYELREKMTDQSGRTSINIIPIVLRPSRKNWLAMVADDQKWSTLKRLQKPFGIAIARKSEPLQ